MFEQVAFVGKYCGRAHVEKNLQTLYNNNKLNLMRMRNCSSYFIRLAMVLLLGTVGFNLSAIAESPSHSESEQSRKAIKGKVVDSEGEPVLGAAIVVEGTSDGVLVDDQGNFSLTVSGGGNSCCFSTRL